MIQHLWEAIRAQLANPFLSGGFLMMFTGAIIAYFRKLPGTLWARILDQFVVSVTVENRDPLFDWITLWLNDHPYSQKTRQLTATTIAQYAETDEVEKASGMCQPTPALCNGAEEETVKRPRLILSPAKGMHLLVYKGTLLWLSRGDNAGTPKGTPMRGSIRLEPVRDEAWRAEVL